MRRKRFNYKQSQILLEKNEDIEGQVKILIAKLNTLHEDYFKASYLILKKILLLRQTQIRNYGVSKLAKEKGINLTPPQVSYIFGYQYISPSNLEKIEKGTLKISTVLYIIKQNNQFRNPQFQDKAVEMYQNGLLNTSSLSRMSADNILKGVVSGKEISLADKQSLRILEYMLTSLKDLTHRENLFKDRNVINQIRLCGERITSQCERILKFGKNLDKERNIPQNKNNPYKFLDEKS